MKILKRIILILSIALTSCQKEDVLPLVPTTETKPVVKVELPQWLNIPNGFASFVQFDFNNDKSDDVIMFEGYDVNVAYTWPGPTFYSGNPLTKINLPIDNKKIFGSKLIAADLVAFNVGNANSITANITAGNTTTANLGFSGIIPQNSVERSVMVGQNNYIAFTATAATIISITELGATHANFTGQ